MKRTPRTALIAVVLLLSFSYQNCGEGEFDETSLGSTHPGMNAPFAYEARLDQISYMSCRQGHGNFADNVADPRAYYSFRAGAYGSAAGVRFREEFINYADEHYDPPYGSDTPPGQATPGQIAELLQFSGGNRNAQLQLALRTMSAPRVEVITTTNGVMRADADYQNILAPLTVDALAHEMASTQRGKWISLFNSGSGYTNRRVEGSLDFTKTEEATFYPLVINSGILSLTYTMDLDVVQGNNVEVVARGPDDSDLKRAYGVGYKMSFSKGISQETNSKRRVLSVVEEIALPTGGIVRNANWECPGRLRYVIVHPKDQDEACPQENFNQATEQQVWDREILRNQLGAEDWMINTKLRCVVPKVGTCYGVPPSRDINYAATSSADLCDDDNINSPACAHWVSFCIARQ